MTGTRLSNVQSGVDLSRDELTRRGCFGVRSRGQDAPPRSVDRHDALAVATNLHKHTTSRHTSLHSQAKRRRRGRMVLPLVVLLHGGTSCHHLDVVRRRGTDHACAIHRTPGRTNVITVSLQPPSELSKLPSTQERHFDRPILKPLRDDVVRLDHSTHPEKSASVLFSTSTFKQLFFPLAERDHTSSYTVGSDPHNCYARTGALSAGSPSISQLAATGVSI